MAGEIGDAKNITDPNFTQKIYLPRHNLEAWEAGIEIDDSGFSLAGSYGNWGNSGQLKVLQNTGCKRSDYWTVGGSYVADEVGFSITYFGSNRCGLDSAVGYLRSSDEAESKYRLRRGEKALPKAKEVEILSFGLDTKLAPGFMPFAELSFFKLNENNAAATKDDLISVEEAKDFIRSSHNRKNKGYVLMSGVKILF